MFSQIQLLRTFVVILLFLTSSVLYAQSIEMRDLSRTLASDTLTLEEKRALVGTQAFYGNGENIFTINFQNRLNGNQWEIIATDKLGQTIGFGNFRILSTLGLFDSASKRLHCPVVDTQGDSFVLDLHAVNCIHFCARCLARVAAHFS